MPSAVVQSALVDNSEVMLDRVMEYQFHPLIARLQDKLGWSEAKASSVFEDMKRFVFMCAAVDGGPFTPPADIDECWHHFILFTGEYANFCEEHFRRFIHHRPRYPHDTPSDSPGMLHTVETARRTFGDSLSENWPCLSDALVHECAGSKNCQCKECRG